MYRVAWKRTATNALAQIWMDAADRDGITAASHAIDQALALDPDNEGESRPHGQRVMFHSPLAVRFKVYPKQQLVRVLAVWRIR